METISQMTAAAAKMALDACKTGTEPISGVQGNVARGEPYDAGNFETKDQERLGREMSGGAEQRDSAASEGAYAAGAGASKLEDRSTHPSNLAQLPRSSGVEEHDGSRAANADDDDSIAATQQHGASTDPNRAGSDPQNATQTSKKLDKNTATPPPPGEEGPSSSGDVPESAPGLASEPKKAEHQSSTSAGAAAAAAAAAADDDKDLEDVDVSGAGPRDIAEVARENGGDAGRIRDTDSRRQQPDSASDDRAAEEDDGEEEGAADSGTGEKYVRSTGLKADGGDFDATAPGAGREAERLLGEKGVHASGGGEKSDGRRGGGEGKEKHRLIHKIKEKLHRQ